MNSITRNLTEAEFNKIRDETIDEIVRCLKDDIGSMELYSGLKDQSDEEILEKSDVATGYGYNLQNTLDYFRGAIIGDALDIAKSKVNKT